VSSSVTSRRPGEAVAQGEHPAETAVGFIRVRRGANRLHLVRRPVGDAGAGGEELGRRAGVPDLRREPGHRGGAPRERRPVGVVVQRQTAGGVIGGHQNERVGMGARPLENRRDRLVEARGLGDDAGGVEVVSGVVDTTAFDHQQERPLGGPEAAERETRELRHCRVAPLRRIAAIVELVGQVRVGEQAEQAALAVPDQRIAAQENLHPARPRFGDEVAAVETDAVLLARQEVRQPAAERDVDIGVEQLRGDGLLVVAIVMVGVEAGGRRVGDARVGDVADAPAGGLRRLADRARRALLGVESEKAVVGLRAGGKGGRRGAAVGDEVRRRPGRDEPGHRHRFEREPAATPLRGVAREGDLREAEPIAEEQDDGARSGG
jgi:hypothetical protein